MSDLHGHGFDLPGSSTVPSIETWFDPKTLVERLGEPLQVTLLAHNPLNAVTGGIWRVAGPAGSVVVKVVTDGRFHEGPDWWGASTIDHHWNSWRREVLVYRTRFAGVLEPDGLGSPELLDERDLDSGTVVLVLEDVAGRTGGSLTVDDLEALAGALGRAQGRLAVADDWQRPWQSQGLPPRVRGLEARRRRAASVRRGVGATSSRRAPGPAA